MSYELPPELISRILINLTSVELVNASQVCQLWHDLVFHDPSLRRAAFKAASQYYFEEGSEPILPGALNSDQSSTYSESSATFRFHPALQKTSYKMGEPIDSIHLCNGQSLIDLELKHDLVCIPSITSMEITILPAPVTAAPMYIPPTTSIKDRRRSWPSSSSSSNTVTNYNNWARNTNRPITYPTNRKVNANTSLPGINVTITNPNGIRIIDLFQSIVSETSKLCDLIAYASGGRTYQRLNSFQPPMYCKTAEILGKQKTYAGMSTTSMTISETGKPKFNIRTIA